MIRLSKYLQESGVASRRKADALIFSKHVSINGTVVDTPFTRVGAGDEVFVDGERVEPRGQKVYFFLNKPKGFVCTNAPGPRRVVDLFAHLPYRLFTIGRLDKETEGLIIVTNDGDFAQRVIHPSSNIEKEYIAKVDLPVSDIHIRAIGKGMEVEGTFVRPLLVEKISKDTLRVVLGEGKKREVRRLLGRAGFETVALKRVRIGGLHLGRLPVGHYKPLLPSQLFN